MGLNSETRFATARQLVLKKPLFNKLQPYENTVNCKRKSRLPFFLLMRSRTPPISWEFRGRFEHPKPTPSVRHWYTDCLIFFVCLHKLYCWWTIDRKIPHKIYKCICFYQNIFLSNQFTPAIMHSTQTSKGNVKRSVIRCIPIRSPMAYVNLLLHYLTISTVPTTLVLIVCMCGK